MTEMTIERLACTAKNCKVDSVMLFLADTSSARQDSLPAIFRLLFPGATTFLFQLQTAEISEYQSTVRLSYSPFAFQENIYAMIRSVQKLKINFLGGHPVSIIFLHLDSKTCLLCKNAGVLQHKRRLQFRCSCGGTKEDFYSRSYFGSQGG